ncbi:uncharacterized protein [Ptychodera flava]|uniref:uncharacterized protein n=1 Tax=Ptychodera flava TaxID=63121 RepID=UPI00396A92C9
MALIGEFAADIKAFLKNFDDDYVNAAWNVLRESIVEVRRLIIWLTNIQIKSRDVDREAHNAIREVKRVYRILLEECKNIKHFSKQCEYMLQCLQAEIISRHSGIDTFLFQHRLERYKVLFESEDIEYISEIVEMELTQDLVKHFKDNMQFRDFKVLMKQIEKAATDKQYIENCMEEDLTRLGNQCKSSSQKVTSLLTKSLSETEKVTLSIIGYLESEKSMNEAAGVGFKVLSALGLLAMVGGMLAFSLPGFIVAGVGAAATGGGVAGTVVTQIESAKITRQIKDIKSMMFTWEGVIKHGITSWKHLIIKFNELATLLREGVVKLEDEELYDITSHFQAAEKSLRNFSKQINDFAEEVQLVVST